MRTNGNRIKITFIGGGSQMWGPTIIRDIICKPGLQELDIDFVLMDIDLERAQTNENLFNIKMREWKFSRVQISSTSNADEALSGADFVIIAISTGRLDAMRNDLDISEQYGIYHTVGDTAGPGGWSRALRNIPVFRKYGQKIRELAPDAIVLNYTNPMGVLTRVLNQEIGVGRVVGLCHAIYECYDIFKDIFGLDSEKQIKMLYGGLNHFFWILDLKINGRDGYNLLTEMLRGDSFASLLHKTHKDAMGWSSDKCVTSELYANYGYLPYIGDRHICEFFSSYLIDLKLMEEYKLVRTTIADREAMYTHAQTNIEAWMDGLDDKQSLSNEPSREVAADIVKAVVFDEPYIDVVNTPNRGQIYNLPMGVVVETPGTVDADGFKPLTVGPMPEYLAQTISAHAFVQTKTFEAAYAENTEDALRALMADPLCSHLSLARIREMGLMLIEANKPFVDAALSSF